MALTRLTGPGPHDFAGWNNHSNFLNSKSMRFQMNPSCNDAIYTAIHKLLANHRLQGSSKHDISHIRPDNNQLRTARNSYLTHLLPSTFDPVIKH
jgi:hypothetical protein